MSGKHALSLVIALQLVGGAFLRRSFGFQLQPKPHNQQSLQGSEMRRWLLGQIKVGYFFPPSASNPLSREQSGCSKYVRNPNLRGKLCCLNGVLYDDPHGLYTCCGGSPCLTDVGRRIVSIFPNAMGHGHAHPHAHPHAHMLPMARRPPTEVLYPIYEPEEPVEYFPDYILEPTSMHDHIPLLPHTMPVEGPPLEPRNLPLMSIVDNNLMEQVVRPKTYFAQHSQRASAPKLILLDGPIITRQG